MAGPRYLTAAKQAAESFQELPVPEGFGIPGTEAYKHDELAYQLSLHPARTPRRVKVVMVGAGFSGLNIAHAVESGKLQRVDLEIFEKNTNIGGTWFENRYPGCGSDIPVHNYQLSWAPNPRFTSFYGTAPELQDYIEKVADQHGLRKYVKTSHKVVHAKWVAGKQKWEVTVVRTSGRPVVLSRPGLHDDEVGEPWTVECDFFVNGSGLANNWKWPTIPGRELFKGDMLHTADWPQKHDFTGQTVSLIGNGSSGVQVLPHIVEQADKVYVHIRNGSWFTVGFASRFAGPDGRNIDFTDEQKDLWTNDHEEYFRYRKLVEQELNARFKTNLKGSKEQDMAREFCLKEMSKQLVSKPELLKAITPEFPVGCRRPTPAEGYLAALCSPKVEIVWGETGEFTPEGIRGPTGREFKVDSIVCATGFDISFVPRFPIVGSNGVDLQKKWTDNIPEGYMSVTVEDMPNYFVYQGPPGPLVHGSVVLACEIATDWMVQVIDKCQRENYSSVVLKPGVARAYAKHTMAWIEKTVWTANCTSTYRNGKSSGQVYSIHAGSRLHYFQQLQKLRAEDFDWTSLCEDPDLRFAWLGNGFTIEETFPDADGKVDLT
ncbi:hypothetical protein PV08_04173 [Exophiala spinifera]|uniref:FAD/NAD(P)-binding domain-containing protein n=1 Tax=Exophiala spinifera TaxID=91928 RepID=A0A0D1ZWE0_9EURO|nr:uncharacterized protein PV08_04173 [Exophiala spinifera]KIW16982.1 hypothetical protein PV08_04173 [Exophiala spinifera]